MPVASSVAGRAGAASGLTVPVLGFGAWLKNAVCLFDPAGTQWSEIHGDLGDPAARLALRQSVDSLTSSAAGRIRAVAHDLHPDFYSTEYALETAARLGVPAIGVQHHHAHIGAVIAAHALEGPVIGLALDGVGLGTDGLAWGGELLWVDGPHWARLGHLLPMALPGGDRAAVEPWRMAASALHQLGRNDDIVARFTDQVGRGTANGVAQLLNKNINCPQTTSAGRWFDVAAGALAVSIRQIEEAQAARALEQLATDWLNDHQYHTQDAAITITPDNHLDPGDMFQYLLDTPDAQRGQAAAHFHLEFAGRLAEWTIRACAAHGTSTVCLGGGCFYNRLIRERLIDSLRAAGLAVYLPGQYGCGDAGLALGQAWVAHQQLHAAGQAADKGFELCV